MLPGTSSVSGRFMPSKPASSTQSDLSHVLEDIGGLKERIKDLESAVETAKTENKGWIKKWGVYLGVLASVVAVPKAAKEALDSWYQRPNVKIEKPASVTLTLQEGGLIFSFPVDTSNYGNRGGSIFGGRAHLEDKSQPPRRMDAARDRFKLVDENKTPGNMPFPVPAGLAKPLTGFVNFSGNAVSVPGWYTLEVTLEDENGKPLPKTPMRFCFFVTPSQIENLSSMAIEQDYPNCEGGSEQ